MFNKKNHRLSIVIPILNEAKNINILVPKIVNCIKNKIKKYEIIIVDDDSDDDISKIIFKLKKRYKFIKFIQRKGKTKRDLSQSCLSGFKKTKYENIPENLRDHSLFIAFAPAEKPEVAIAVIVENDYTAPNIARKVLDSYFEPVDNK